MMEQNRKAIPISLIYKKFSKKLTEKEEKEFQEWLGESPAHAGYFERMRYYFEQMPEAGVSEKEVDDAWNAFSGKVVLRRSRMRTRRMWYGAGVAAMITVLLGVWMLWKGTGAEVPRLQEQTAGGPEITPGQYAATLELAGGELHRLGNTGRTETCIREHIVADSGRLSYVRPDSRSMQVVYNKLSVPRGGEYQLKLEDGTRVWLNSASQLKYPEVFVGRQREVFLEGEAYFEVAADTLRPFVVHAGNQLVKVLGTGFGMTYYADEACQTVTLVKGKVEVGFREAVQDKFILTPGKQMVYDRNSHRVACKKVDVREYVAWKDGKYVFTQKRLEEILNTLSRWYDFQVFYQNARCKDILFSGEIKRFENFRSILELIQKTSDVSFGIRDNTVQVMAN